MNSPPSFSFSSCPHLGDSTPVTSGALRPHERPSAVGAALPAIYPPAAPLHSTGWRLESSDLRASLLAITLRLLRRRRCAPYLGAAGAPQSDDGIHSAQGVAASCNSPEDAAPAFLVSVCTGRDARRGGLRG